MKVLVTGANGQLGYDVMGELTRQGHLAIGVDVEEMDITNSVVVDRVLEQHRPDAVIHCAAYTAVDAAEENVALCRAVNVTGTENVAKSCATYGCKLMYISTDYVFDGQGTHTWEPDDECHPINIYGKTKYEGELAVETYVTRHFIVRIAWVFGVNGKNFVKTMLNMGKTHNSLTVVVDQIGSPTYTYDLSHLLVDMIETEYYGKYHATNEGLCSWYEFACEIFKQAGMSVIVTPVESSSYPTKAKRPMNSRMSKEKLIANGFSRLPTWQDALTRYLHVISANNE